jgi:Flp pilus assembly protein protease CpaA
MAPENSRGPFLVLFLQKIKLWFLTKNFIAGYAMELTWGCSYNVHRKEEQKTATIIVIAILTVACMFDAKYFKIPNQLIVIGYGAGFIMNVLTYQINGFLVFLLKAMWPILLLFLLTVIKGLGAGDVKLFSVMATMVGPKEVCNTMIGSVILAGIIAFTICLKNKKIVKRRLHYSYYIAAAFFMLQFVEMMEVIK